MIVDHISFLFMIMTFDDMIEMTDDPLALANHS